MKPVIFLTSSTPTLTVVPIGLNPFIASKCDFFLQIWSQPYRDIFLNMFTPARDFLLETPWRIIIPNPNVNSQSLSS
jgi:hypothetical protein